MAEIRVPSARSGLPAQRLGLVLANLIGASEPAKVARAGRVLAIHGDCRERVDG